MDIESTMITILIKGGDFDPGSYKEDDMWR